MSKSLSGIYLPVFGGIALVCSVAVAVANRGYGDSQIETLQTRLAQVEAQKAAALTEAEASAARLAELETRLAELESKAGNTVAGGEPVAAHEGAFGLGRPALPEEIAAWDVDVLPDGRGLPEGSGDVSTGEEVFAEKCAACHGDFAEGVDNWPVLAGGFGTLADEDPVKTVGSYWPYLTTVWDYVHRSMPFGEAGTLSADETYAIVAYILYSNDLVDDEFELNQDNLATFEMPNRDGFVIDDRPQREYAEWRTEPCMENCKDSVEITKRATFLDVTPDHGGDSVMNSADTSETPTFTAANATAEEVASADAADAGDAELIAAGKKVFKKCSACHQVGDGAKNKTGPHLNGLIGRTIGSVDGFGYSSVFKQANEEGRIWDQAALDAFLAKPKAYMTGTKMSFAGLKKEQDRAALNAYLATFGE
ncbi:sulfur dehydrogenase subunit SoxD [Ruegeria intermedia]|uniref:Sulfur dehydrogenase subunit SoxD n=1 Tax=Ruegeria intermedia TaxID=996115 RepID=A0A1M4W1E3_9RHOB|nr:c-type cytochrome [Ruegeria intermedia]SHE74943.1 sulfur dehydrogenase subunit SoxD [Ruegeria intermedia]